jgi:predicted dehydrogenase
MSCFPMIRQARETVAAGGIGKINQIHVEFMQDWMIPEGASDAPHVQWRLDPTKSGRTSCVGDIGTHAAHLASFVSQLELTDVRCSFHVCGAPKPLEDTFFAWTRFGGDVPGTLMATRLAPGNRGGLRLRVFGSEGGLEWDLEQCDRLRFNRFGEADQIISRGHGHGVSSATERLVRSARGFPEGIIEAWANLYTEFALAVAARRDGIALPDGYLGLPRVEAGRDGVRFIDACVASDEADGAWVEL